MWRGDGFRVRARAPAFSERPGVQLFSTSRVVRIPRAWDCRVPSLPKRVLTWPHASSQLVRGRFTHRLPRNSVYLRDHLRRGHTFGGTLLLGRFHRVLYLRLPSARSWGPRLALGGLQRQHRFRAPLRTRVRGLWGEGAGPPLPHEPSQQRGRAHGTCVGSPWQGRSNGPQGQRHREGGFLGEWDSRREDREEAVAEGKGIPELMSVQKRLAGCQHMGRIAMAPLHTFERSKVTRWSSLAECPYLGGPFCSSPLSRA